MIKAYFLDLDGTLLDVKKGKVKSMSEQNRKAIIETSKQALMVVSTGRPYHDFAHIYKNLPFKYVIGRNGAFIHDIKGKVLKYQPMNYEIGNELVTFCKEHKFFMKFNDIDAIYRKNWIFEKIVQKYTTYSNKSWKHFIAPSAWEKIVLFAHSKRKIRKYLPILKSKFPQFAIVASGGGWIIEITDEKATKGIAALQILKWEKIDSKNAAHIGDSMNDSDAMRLLGYGIAMSNSPKELIQNYATHIGPHYKNGGVAKVLQGEFKLIKK